jgi:hypothetical protein
MIRLFDADSGKQLGEISEAQLGFLQTQMEEESETDQEYYLNASLLEIWKEQGADAGLLELLSNAMAGKDELNLRWSR